MRHIFDPPPPIISSEQAAADRAYFMELAAKLPQVDETGLTADQKLSHDEKRAKIQALKAADPAVRIVDLAERFGVSASVAWRYAYPERYDAQRDARNARRRQLRRLRR